MRRPRWRQSSAPSCLRTKRPGDGIADDGGVGSQASSRSVRSTPKTGRRSPARLLAPPAASLAHVQSEHFKSAQQTLPRYLAATPKIVNFTVPQDDWSELGEMAVAGDS